MNSRELEKERDGVGELASSTHLVPYVGARVRVNVAMQRPESMLLLQEKLSFKLKIVMVFRISGHRKIIDFARKSLEPSLWRTHVLEHSRRKTVRNHNVPQRVIVVGLIY